jgi:hypothetical protein
MNRQPRIVNNWTTRALPNGQIPLDSYEIAVPPSLTLTISARVVSGNASNVTAALTYYEDL